ncbi:MAG TPA: hypothetical protein PKH77_17000 [Anaerolineae bacterium]|nr:hypothetical protein [Anaerolineae bacterium]
MNTPFTCLSVLIVAPPGRLRDGLHVLLQASGLQVAIRQADDGADALRLIPQVQPRVLLLDVGLVDAGSWQRLRQIKAAWPPVRCCVLVHTTAQARCAWEGGADAVLPAGFAAEHFFGVLRELAGEV